jgi:hypothetical protein
LQHPLLAMRCNIRCLRCVATSVACTYFATSPFWLLAFDLNAFPCFYLTPMLQTTSLLTSLASQGSCSSPVCHAPHGACLTQNYHVRWY